MRNLANFTKACIMRFFEYCLLSKSRMDVITTILSLITVVAEALHEGINVVHEPLKVLSLVALALWGFLTNRVKEEAKNLQKEYCKNRGCKSKK